MSFNKIKKINKGTFKGLKSLMRLYLDHNQIEFINPEAFYGLTNLQLVHLESNHLQQLHPDTFITMRHNQVFKVSSVRTLHLSDNQLETLPADVFSGCSKLENLFLHGNPWACDCRMSWFAGWAQKNTGEESLSLLIFLLQSLLEHCVSMLLIILHEMVGTVVESQSKMLSRSKPVCKPLLSIDLFMY